jgi:AcrR family transcriptional regulator
MMELTARQKEIVEVAIKLIHEGGIQHVTMKNLAHALRISEPAIYRHFQNKTDILLSMLEQFKQRSGNHLQRARALNESGIKQLEMIFLEHSGQFTAHPHMSAVVFSEEAFQDNSQLSEKIFSVMTLAHDTIVEIIDSAQQHGEIRDDLPKEHLALMILGALRLMVKRWRLSNYAFDLREESQRMWASLNTLLAVKKGAVQDTKTLRVSEPPRVLAS